MRWLVTGGAGYIGAHVVRLLLGRGDDVVVYDDLSSAAVYGMPDVEIVREDTRPEPINPYGETKLVGEWMLWHAVRAHGLRGVALRYFNVAGADEAGELGDPWAFNLIPLVFEAIRRGERPKVFGDDYPTPDGTCIRDYVHVVDLAEAHLAAADALDGPACGEAFNVGAGRGFSVLEVMDAVERVTGHDLEPEPRGEASGRPGGARCLGGQDLVRPRLAGVPDEPRGHRRYRLARRAAAPRALARSRHCTIPVPSGTVFLRGRIC